MVNCWGGGFSAAYCCNPLVGHNGRSICWDSIHTFDVCCSALLNRSGWPVDVDADLIRDAPREHPLMDRHAYSTSLVGQRSPAKHWRCHQEIHKIGWWSESACSSFRQTVDAEVRRPPAGVLYLGAHLRLALRRLPYVGFLASVEETEMRAGHFPRQFWDSDGWGLWDAGYTALLRRGDVVIDVGAGPGMHTLLMALSVGVAGTVHAFEPFRITFQHLNANVALSGLMNVFTYRQAVSGKTTPSVWSARPWLEDIAETLEVPRGTLDEVAAFRKNLIFIRINAGDSILQVLHGAVETLKAKVPAVLISFLPSDIDRRRISLTFLVRVLGYMCASAFSPQPADVFCYHERRNHAGELYRIQAAARLWTTEAAYAHCARCEKVERLPLEAGEVQEILAMFPSMNAHI